jgi:pyruvate carboxylase
MKKLLVANRGEIAIRVMRAATELGLRTVAVYTYEDRFSLHRFKADESYQLGSPTGGEPVKGYLNIKNIVDVAKAAGVEFIHPGYGFLSERAEFAQACKDAGINFVGPSADLLNRFGDKTAAKELADKVGVPTIPGTGHGMKSFKEVATACKKIGYPVILKASFGGGGRGMRVVLSEKELESKLEEAQREAGAAFGRPEVFVEKYIRRAKHIEVQIIGDKHGNLVHLWERDCSVQRRHQKVVEVAPAAKMSLKLRKAICESARNLMAGANYTHAGTVEFLVDADEDKFYFIEVNPRVQVEHTVTEMVTGIDIVKTQILIAQGHALHQAPINIPKQDKIETRGVAIQCRITTEDAENNFIPDYGKLTAYRSPAGFGIRLDGASAYGGAVITPFFDSLLVKVTAHDQTLEDACHRMDRALREFRIRGVKSNIPFLENVIQHKAFIDGDCTTTFIDNTPELFAFKPRQDRATKLLSYLGDVIVNSRPDVKAKLDAKRKLPEIVVPEVERASAIPDGSRTALLKLGAKKFCDEWIPKQKRLLLTDTTMRDAHQSLLATRVRTYDMLRIADFYARNAAGLFSLECWGGATFDTSMRFLQEDPWERLAELRQRVPNILFQMLLRGANAVGYTNYPDNVVTEFVKVSGKAGMDVFRIFDSLNWPEGVETAMRAVREHTSGICEAAICYTGDILDAKRDKYTLKYYVDLAKKLEKMGAHILCIKDMAGLCRPYAAKKLVKALSDEIGVPIHFHTHDTSGLNAASILNATDSGVHIADAAMAAFSGQTSQPNLNSIVAALQHTPRDTKLNLDALNRISDYWEQVRAHYYPFEEDIKTGTAEVYQHEMPGGQYTNLKQQAKSLGLEHRWRDVAAAYAAVNQLFGDIVKVTPSSKVVGDMALFMVTNDLSVDDVLDAGRKLSFPKSVVEMMQGLIGQPAGGWPKVVQKIILDSAGAKPLPGRPGATMKPVDFKKTRAEIAEKTGRDAASISDEDLMSYLMYPQVYVDFEKHNAKFSRTSVIPTSPFFYGLKVGEEVTIEIEPGKSLIVRLISVSAPQPDGTRNVSFELNGQPRDVTIVDRSLAETVKRHAKADPDNAHHVGAPMPGKVTNIAVKKGQAVKAGERLLSIEAMKMETAVYAPRDAKVGELHVTLGTTIASGDLLLVLE